MNSIIDYFEHYNILIESRLIKTCKKSINSIFILNNGDIAAFHNYLMINIDNSNYLISYDDNVNSICQLENNMVIVSTKKSIFIYDIIPSLNEDINSVELLFTIEPVNDSFDKVISLSQNKIAVSSLSNTIYIYSINSSSILLAKLKGHTNTIESMIYLSNKKHIISAEQNIIILWSLISFQSVMHFDIKDNSIRALYQIDDNRVIIGGFSMISVIDITNGRLCTKIYNNYLNSVNCLIKTKHKMILCGCNEGKFCILNTDNYKYYIIPSKHYISDIIFLGRLNSNTIISCNQDGEIISLKDI